MRRRRFIFAVGSPRPSIRAPGRYSRAARTRRVTPSTSKGNNYVQRLLLVTSPFTALKKTDMSDSFHGVQAGGVTWCPAASCSIPTQRRTRNTFACPAVPHFDAMVSSSFKFPPSAFPLDRLPRSTVERIVRDPVEATRTAAMNIARRPTAAAGGASVGVACGATSRRGERRRASARHTFCSHLALRGALSRAIQELAGAPTSGRRCATCT
jgi:hypothetical protein